MAEERVEGHVSNFDFYVSQMTVDLDDGTQRVLHFQPEELHTYIGFSLRRISCMVEGDVIKGLAEEE